LLRLLQDAGEQVPDSVRQAGRLSRFAVFTRYPGIARPVSQEEYQDALTLAEEVVRWAEEKLHGHWEEPLD